MFACMDTVASLSSDLSVVHLPKIQHPVCLPLFLALSNMPTEKPLDPAPMLNHDSMQRLTKTAEIRRK